MTLGRGAAERTPARPRRLAAEPPGPAAEAVRAVLAKGGLAAVPTETVYGLCADARSPEAVARLYAVKGRPASNPLIVHVADADAARAVADLGRTGEALARAFWPGPLTLVAPRRPGAGVAEQACAGGPTVAVRVPRAPVLSAVAAALGPVVAPSANRSGRVSATTAEAVAEELGAAVDLVVDGGPSPIGVESTVVDLTGPRPRILRPGAVTAGAIEAVAGPLDAKAPARADGAAPLRSPGLLASHYAPRARLRLDVAPEDVRADEAFLALGPAASAAPPERTFHLSLTGDLDEAARNLYAGLRALDATGAAVIAVSPVSADGIGAAIRDRLARAAAPRPEPAER